MSADTYIQFLLALVVVLALIGVLAWLARKFGFGLVGGPVKRGKRRLAVVETAPVDAKRRLVLIRRDATEHLVLLGPNSETLIEPGIRGGQETSAPAAAAPATAGETEAPE
jgi:flagellar protein FliO/FliZ